MAETDYKIQTVYLVTKFNVEVNTFQLFSKPFLIPAVAIKLMRLT